MPDWYDRRSVSVAIAGLIDSTADETACWGDIHPIYRWPTADPGYDQYVPARQTHRQGWITAR